MSSPMIRIRFGGPSRASEHAITSSTAKHTMRRAAAPRRRRRPLTTGRCEPTMGMRTSPATALLCLLLLRDMTPHYRASGQIWGDSVRSTCPRETRRVGARSSMPTSSRLRGSGEPCPPTAAHGNAPRELSALDRRNAHPGRGPTRRGSSRSRGNRPRSVRGTGHFRSPIDSTGRSLVTTSSGLPLQRPAAGATPTSPPTRTPPPRGRRSRVWPRCAPTGSRTGRAVRRAHRRP